MRALLIFIFLLSVKISSVYSNDIWQEITKKSWTAQGPQTFAGEQFVFLKTESGLSKSIEQIFGSGVYVVGNVIDDVSIKGDTIFIGNDSTISNKNEDSTLIKYMIYSRENTCLTDDRNIQYVPKGLVIYNWLGDYMMGEKVFVDKAILMLSIEK